ncbi:MAG: class D sortase [Anaerolineales bacterium]|nr:class D sortase [Anaerolineales bacterium]
MTRRKAPEDLSVEELRRLLIEKRRGARRERLEHFKRTGRVADVEPDSLAPVVDTLEGSSDQPQVQVSTRRRVIDRVLLVVEVLAVVGLVGVLISGFSFLREVNEQAASLLIQETLTPTPLVMAVVLPSGHLPPDAQGNTRPNDAEIPEHLRPMVQSLASIAIPTAAPDQAIRLQLPAINIDAPIVQGDGWEQLKKGVGQSLSSVNPGQVGNVVLSAHNDVYGELFRNLDRLAPGDQVILYTQQRQYVYVVDRTAIVEPTAVEVMASTGSPTVTLISCYPYLVDKQRIVVFARLQN